MVEGEIGFGKSCFCSKDDSRGVCGQVGRSPTCNRERYDSPHLRGSGIGVCAKNAKKCERSTPRPILSSWKYKEKCKTNQDVDELKEYFKIPLENEDVSPRQWWVVNQYKFPRQLHAIPDIALIIITGDAVD